MSELAARMQGRIATRAAGHGLDRVVDRLGAITGILALPILLLGLYLGLVWAPPDAFMGDIQRIMYVHFPSWIATALAYGTAFVASALYLLLRRPELDALAVAGVEVGAVFNASGVVTGAIWGRPTWGVYWTWDPRLTTTAIMLAIFVVYLLLRAFIEDPERRARVTAVVAIVGFVNVPIVYFSVRWWRTLHQMQSSPATVDPHMVVALRTMMIAATLIACFLMSRRYELARLRDASELEPNG
jgi:heme exporter protein C